MIKIYLADEFYRDFLEIISSTEYWDYPLAELDYLLKDRKGETFILMGDRLKETTGIDVENYLRV